MTSDATDEPEAAVEVEVASKSDVGQVRSANEDSCDIFERADGTRLLVLADGMGGHQGGATASQTAVAVISELFTDDSSNDLEEMILNAIVTANERIFELAQNDPTLEGMGTTVVAFLLDPNGQGIVAHVGDSRAYRYRQGELEALTVDHSIVAEMHRRGLISAAEAATHPRRNEITRSVGVVAAVEVEVAAVEVSPGDRFVLCSDGLTGVVNDDEIAAVVQVASTEAAVDRLIELANEHGGPDNISVQILSIPADPSEGDPEATAPVELSEVGIQAIEAKRKERTRKSSLAMTLIALGVCLGLYFAWLTFRPSTEPRTPKPLPEVNRSDMGEPSPTPSPLENAEDPTTEDSFETESDPPRRGIPR